MIKIIRHAAKVTASSFIGRAVGVSFLLFFSLMLLSSCSEDTPEYNPYYDWQSRNATWYRQVADSARTAISQARRQYGDLWQQHCNWRMYKSLQLSQTTQSGVTEDSICVRILSNGTGSFSPTYADSVRVCFRGWLMPTPSEQGTLQETTFTQTYYGDYNPATAAPQLAAVGGFKDGFSTALQYMVAGDDWMVYIPQELFYGSLDQDAIPAYSAVRFRIQLVAIYPSGTDVPAWK